MQTFMRCLLACAVQQSTRLISLAPESWAPRVGIRIQNPVLVCGCSRKVWGGSLYRGGGRGRGLIVYVRRHAALGFAELAVKSLVEQDKIFVSHIGFPPILQRQRYREDLRFLTGCAWLLVDMSRLREADDSARIVPSTSCGGGS